MNRLHGYELEWIRLLQGVLRGPFLDNLMFFLTFFDTLTFYFFLITFVWFFYDRKCGIGLLFLFVLNTFLVLECKTFFHQPRPFTLDPSVGIISAHFFGLPSGAAQETVALFGFLALTVRKFRFTLFAIFFALLVSFSRVYLGVHFISDIVGGWLLGGLLLALYYKGLPYIGRVYSSMKRWQKVVSILLASVFLYSISNSSTAIGPIMWGLGASLGLFYPQEVSFTTNWKTRLTRAFVSFFGAWVLLLLSISPYLFAYNRAVLGLIQLLLGFWISFGAPFLLKKTAALR